MEASRNADDVDQRCDWVLLLHDLLALTERAGTLSQALQGTVDRISRELRWPVGHFFTPRDDGVLEFAGGVWKLPAVGGEELILGSQGAVYRPGESWIGQAAERREQLWVTDLATTGERFGDARLRPALALGLRGLVVQPVTLDDRVLATIELFSSQPLPPSPHLRDLILQAAAHLSRLAARFRVEDELHRVREEMAVRQRERVEFLTDLSHRVRTPMNAVIAMSELLMRTGLTPQQRDFTATVRAGGEEVMAIIEDALEFLGIEIGRREARRAPAPPDEAAADEVAAEEVTAEEAIVHERPLRVLVVEDNLVNQKVAVKILELLEHAVETVSSGDEALAALAERAFDVVLMDVEMPQVDGYETTRRIRRRPGAVQPWIVAMTARAMPGDREACLAAGMDDYVSKPVSIDALRAALERVGGETPD